MRNVFSVDRMKKIQRKKNEMRAAKEKREVEIHAANILTNDYDEDVLF